jgi:maintenance of mitochondrial morphology protein 1
LSDGFHSLSFTQGFLLGQLSIVVLIFCFIKFFIFGEPPSADDRALHLSSLRRQRTLAHQRSLSSSLRRKASTVLRNPPVPLTTASILAKTYYNVHGHQPESLDWFNVLIAQTIAQLRADARQDDAVLASLTKVMNGPGKPSWVGDIRITEIALGDEFPIFSNCRVIPVEEGGLFDTVGGHRDVTLDGGSARLQARMDVDLSDVITLGMETTLNLNYPKPFAAVLPVALAVTVVRFSGTVSYCSIRSID